jgi:MFS family permease
MLYQYSMNPLAMSERRGRVSSLQHHKDETKRASLWSHRDFTRLWFGQTVSNLGDRISLFAIPTIALIVLHQGAFQVGLLGSLRFLPFLLMGPLAGSWADRFARRNLMIAADLGRMLTLGCIPLLYEVHHLNIGVLYVVAAVAGCLTVVFEVSYQSYLPSLIPQENLIEGNTKLQISRSATQSVGSAVGAGLVALMSAALAVAADALTFLVSAVAVFMIRAREAPTPKMARTGRFRDGWAFLFQHPLLRHLLAASSVSNLGYSMGSALALVLAYQELHLSAWTAGIGLAAGGVGFVTGAMLVKPVMMKITAGRTLALMPLVIGIGYFVMAAGHWTVGLLAFAVGQFITGWATSVYNIPVMTLVQTQTPPQLRGRIVGSALILVWGASALGYILGGLIGNGLGALDGMLAAAAMTALGSVVAFFGPVSQLVQLPPPVGMPPPPAAETESIVVSTARTLPETAADA